MKHLKSILFIFSLLSMNQTMAQTEKLKLTDHDKSIIGISSYAAIGELEKLKPEISKALDLGITINQIKEVMVHSYAYCGFPRSIRGLQTFMEVLNDRKTKGINDSIGNSATSIKTNQSKYSRGKDILGKLTNTLQSDVLTGYSAFAPVIDTFLKEHLFADIFERDVLTYRERELVTISVLGALGNVQPMLTAHLNISLNVGITPDQLKEFISVIGLKLGSEKSVPAQDMLNGVLQNRHSLLQ